MKQKKWTLAQTHDFNKKLPSRTIPLQSLKPIKIADLETGITHRGRVVYCKIVSQVLEMNSKAVLVEDGSDLKPLAIYGSIDTRKLQENRSLAIIEPFYKIRADGTKGIRVDNPNDLVFDSQLSEHAEDHERIPFERPGVEVRLKQMLVEDPTIGVNRIHKALVEEGYKLEKKQIRALKRKFVEQNKSDTANANADKLVPILSDRQPAKHRIFFDQEIRDHKDLGNQLFKAGKMEETEEEYSLALVKRFDAKTEPSNEEEGVPLWQLYSNRCAARIRLGKLEDALKDAFASNICAPADAVKPLLRCAEVLASLGMQREMKELLRAASAEFPQEQAEIERKEESLRPKHCLRVGSDKEYRSIGLAVLAAKTGSEILVDPGVYHEPLLITKALTIRCAADQMDDYAAIESMGGGAADKSWPKLLVGGDNCIVCAVADIRPVRLVGLKIVCEGNPFQSNHSLFVARGTAVVRNCAITSSSGPVVATANPKSRAILQNCAVYKGAQGGVYFRGPRCERERQHHQAHCRAPQPARDTRGTGPRAGSLG